MRPILNIACKTDSIAERYAKYSANTNLLRSKYATPVRINSFLLTYIGTVNPHCYSIGFNNQHCRHAVMNLCLLWSKLGQLWSTVVLFLEKTGPIVEQTVVIV
jgi:hypothetical protein